ncbi:hypothetical protein D7D52_08610 [Nocardia yunnanensis]|uniref:Novel STAND NTPase 1 domain-containing protein n=1 Tax=Nocardia yunnanensis TaxID=2382165 RepID=A0A386Z9R4_9NOCA|nr:hypothetical protein [Nocardia yunnanensis]AYF73913.1 hypothetical protein D7D52_08610 [Nocardia yunnanensis]
MPGEAIEGNTPRAEFAQRLTQLWEFAGNPTLQRVADAANQRMAAAAGPGAKKVNAQRLSDWRRGRNLPAKFDTVRPVLLTVIELARKSDAPAGLLNLNFWRQLWVKSVAWTPDSSCPYRGLESFRAGDARLFFGRDRAIADLVALVEQTAADGGGITVLLGASGAGKSSLLAAGLIPHLGPEWSAAQCTPGARPIENLATALAAIGGERRLLVIDQFEELFTAGAEDSEIAAFLDALSGLDDGVTAVLGIRADFFARCLDHPVLAAAINRRGYVLGAMGEAELSDAIGEPAHTAGLKLDNGLTELIITELLGLGGHDGSGTLPLLSHVMEATWQRRDGNRLTIAGYREVGGVAGSVAKTAEDAWQELGPAARAAAQDLMPALVSVGQGTRDTRRQVPPAELLAHAADPDAAVVALETLSRARLLTLDRDTAALTHEIVLDAWPRLRARIDADREGLMIRQRAETDAQEWITGGRNRTLLYRGDRLRRARAQRRGMSSTGGGFIDAAVTHRRRQLWLQSGLALVLVALLVAALAGYIDNTLTTRERDQAFFARILSDADQLQGSDPTLSAELTALATQSHPDDPDVVSRLIAGQTLPVAGTFVDRHGTVSAPTYLDKGLLATAGADGFIRLWHVDQPGAVTRAGQDIAENGEHVVDIAAKASVVVSGSTDHSVRIRDLTDPDHPKILATLDTGGPVERVAISHDGRLAAAAHGHDITLWDIGDIARPQPIPTTYPHDGSVVDMWFTAGDRALITGTETKLNVLATTDTATLWPVDRNQPTAHGTVVATSSGQLRLAANGDGSLLAIGNSTVEHQDSMPADSEVTIERVDDPNHPVVATPPFSIGPLAELKDMAMSPDGTMLAVLRPLGLSLWNLTDPVHPALRWSPLTGRSVTCPGTARNRGCTAQTIRARFGPDNRTLTLGLQGGTVQQWSLPASVLQGPAAQTLPLAVSPDGKRLLVTGSGSDARVFDISDPDTVRLVNTIPKPGYESAYSLVPTPTISFDGKYVGLPVHGTMTIIDVSQPGETRTVAGFPDAISLAFFHDRAMVLVAYGGLSPRLEVWDVTTPDAPMKRGQPIYVQDSAKLLDTGLNGAVSRDGRVMVLVSNKLQTWQLTNLSTKPTGSIDLDWTGHGRGVAIGPDDKVVAMGSDGGALRLFDIADPARITPLGDPIPATGNTISSLDISADGRHLAIGGTDSTVRLWSFTDPKHPKPQGVSLTPENSSSWQLAFDPSADYLFGAGDDGALRVWNLDPRAALRRICTLTRTTIDDDLAAHYPDKKLPALCR